MRLALILRSWAREQRGTCHARREKTAMGIRNCRRNGLRCSTRDSGGNDRRRLEVHGQRQRERPLHRLEL